MDFFETSASTSSNVSDVGNFIKEDACCCRNIVGKAVCLFFPLPPFSSPSLVWQNWCCRLTGETWTTCWDLWMIIWKKPFWMKRKVDEVLTTTLRQPVPVRLIAGQHFSFSPRPAFIDALTCWPGGGQLLSLFRSCYTQLNVVSSSDQQRAMFVPWSGLWNQGGVNEGDSDPIVSAKPSVHTLLSFSIIYIIKLPYSIAFSFLLLFKI